MPQVDIEELEKKAEKEKSERSGIESKRVGDKTIFRGKVLDSWYENYDECVNANQEAKRQAEFKALGLNEFGQTKEQEAYQKKRQELIRKRQALMEDVAKVDVEISNLKRDSFVAEPKKEESKKGKK